MAKDKSDKAKILENLDQLEESICKKHGCGSVMRGRHAIVDIDAFPTGIISVDIALGCGGLPLGRIIELFGPESSGKTTTALTFIAACQKHFFKDKNRYGVAAFIDAEHALDPEWANKIGVRWDDLLISQPDSGEEAFQILEEMILSGLVDLVIIDSVAALIPQKVLDGDIGDSNIGAQAKLMSQGLGKLKGIINKSKATVIFINQIREKIGVMFGCLHGDTLVDFVDGRSIPIVKVVKERITGKVWSYNEKLNTFEQKEIVDWHDNGVVESSDDFITISAVGPGTKNGNITITVTPTHEIMTDRGWVMASDICTDDMLLSKQKTLDLYDIYTHTYAKIVEIRTASKRQMRAPDKYDLSIEDNKCYSAGGGNGVIVHNSPETTPGGRALKFYATNRMEIKKTGVIKDGDDTVGIKSVIKVVKNKAAPPFRSGAFEICFGMPARPVNGIDCYAAMVEVGLNYKIITKSSTYLRYGDINLGNGMNKAIAFLHENPTVYDQITQQIYNIAFQVTGQNKSLELNDQTSNQMSDLTPKERRVPDEPDQTNIDEEE